MQGDHRGIVAAIGALCALFEMGRFFCVDGCTATKLMHFCPPTYSTRLTSCAPQRCVVFLLSVR